MKKICWRLARIGTLALATLGIGLLVTMTWISGSTGEEFGKVGADLWAKVTEDDHHSHGR